MIACLPRLDSLSRGGCCWHTCIRRRGLDPKDCWWHACMMSAVCASASAAPQHDATCGSDQGASPKTYTDIHTSHTCMPHHITHTQVYLSQWNAYNHFGSSRTSRLAAHASRQDPVVAATSDGVTWRKASVPAGASPLSLDPPSRVKDPDPN